MGGIAGVLLPNKHKLVSKMLGSIAHRGTSSPSIWKSPRATIGAIGFSNINEDPGPKTAAEGKQAIVLDGKLENLYILKCLTQSNQKQNSPSSAILLQAFSDFGINIFRLIRGGFALAVIDESEFILARDQLGIKPLYYGIKEGHLYFASEAKGLVGAVDNVHELPPGHILHSKKGLLSYSSLGTKPFQAGRVLDSIKQLREHLDLSVKRSIPEGVNFGVWLRGGVDSSVIAALARPYVDRLYTFSAGLRGSPDLEYARKVSRYVGSEHYERIYDENEIINVLEKTIYHLESFDVLLVQRAISSYLLSELSADYVPYVLSGEGANELFAGYTNQKTLSRGKQLAISIKKNIAALHNTTLQRLDRSATAHGIGVGIPFLASNVVRYALALPARWKIRGAENVDKWPLRQGIAELLPEDVTWRTRSKVPIENATGNVLTNYANRKITDQEFSRARILDDRYFLRSKEELLYYRIFKRHFAINIPLSEIGQAQHV